MQLQERTTVASHSLTPQQATEMWQPLAVELRRETLVTLVTLLIAQLDAAGAVYANPVSGELEARARDKRQYVGILSTLRLLTVHLLLFHRNRNRSCRRRREPEAERWVGLKPSRCEVSVT